MKAGEILLICHHRRFKTTLRSDAIARQLARRGYDVTLMCISNTARLLVHEQHEGGVLYVETPDLLPGRLRSGWDPWDIIRRISYLRGKKYDLIHAFETRPATIYPVMSYLKKTKTPLVIDWNDWWGRGGLISELRPRWYQWLFGSLETYYEEHFRPLADTLTVISSGLVERAVSLGIKRECIFKIRGGCNPLLFQPADRLQFRNEFGIPIDKIVVGFSAADVTMDSDLALKTLKSVKELHPEVMMMMTGNKPTHLDNLASRLGIQDNFMHLGFLPYEDLPKALSCADIFILPFRNTPANRGRWPHKITDYMCLERPTVTNPVGEMKLLFNEERIGLLADENPDAMAEQISILIKNPAMSVELGKNARRVAETKLSWDKTIDGLEQAYADTILRFHGRKR